MVEGSLLHVLMQTQCHAIAVYHLRQLGPEGSLAGPAGVPTADDPLAVDGQITIGNITLAEPHDFTLHAALLAGDGIGRIHLEVHFVVSGFEAQYLVLRQVQNVVGHLGHEFVGSIS